MPDTSPILTARSTWSAALAACLITACGSSEDSPSGMAAGADAGAAPASSSTASTASTASSGGQLTGATFFHADWEWQPQIDPISQEATLELVSVYRLRRFFDSGLVYVGKSGDADSLACPAQKKDECEKYTYDAARKQVSIGDKAYSVTSGGLEDQEDRWKRVLPDPKVDGSYKLSGYFGLVQGVNPSSKGVTLSLSDGALHATRQSGSYAILAFDLWGSCHDGCELDGRYTVKGNTLTLTSDAGKTVSLFVKREGDELQIGKQWYTP